MTHAPDQPGKRRSRTKHECIIRAAADLVGTMGYADCTIEGIAAQAGVGKQTIYRWWPSKASLYLETYRHLVPPEPEIKANVSCYKHLHRFLCRLFHCYKTTAAGKILVGLITESTHNRQVAETVEQGLFLERSHLLSAPIKKGIDAGELDQDLDVECAAEVIVALIWKRLITSPASLTPAFARHLLLTALHPRAS